MTYLRIYWISLVATGVVGSIPLGTQDFSSYLPEGASLDPDRQPEEYDELEPVPSPNWQGFIDQIADLYRAGESRNYPLFTSLYHLVMRCLDRQVAQGDLEWWTFRRHLQLVCQELTEAEEMNLRQVLEQNNMGGAL